MKGTNTKTTAIEGRDPHAAWWTEHQRLAAEHRKRYLVHGEDANEEGERRYRRLADLEGLLRDTPATTFEGSRVQFMALRLALEDRFQHDDLQGVLSNLNGFVTDIESALERHQLKQQAQRWCWEVRVPSAPPWADHPGKPADAEEIWRVAHAAGGEMGGGGTTESNLTQAAAQKPRSTARRRRVDPSRPSP